MKYTTLAICNQDTRIDALNNKVEYRKSLFMFTIVVCELVASLFTIISSIEGIEYTSINMHYSDTYYETYQNDSMEHELNTPNAVLISSVSPHINYSVHYSFLREYKYFNNVIYRVSIVSFGIPLILTFSLVYTLMSYYVMVTKKSLNYSASLESVDLAREQKVLLLVSSVVCVILLVLLVRVEVFIIFQIVESIITLFQSYVTCKYSRKLIQVLNWKKLDTRIAFGTDNYQYKLYIKTLKSLKTFLVLYNIVVVTFCLHVIVQSLSVTFMILLTPNELFRVYGVGIHFQLHAQFFKYLKNFLEIQVIFEKTLLTISLCVIFFLNLCSISYLFSKINLSCHCFSKCLCLKRNKHLIQPLL